MKAWAGRIDAASIADNGETSTITITAESHLVDLNRNEELRYTHQSQQALHPGDEGFKYVESIQNINLVWGRGPLPAVGGSGGTGGGRRDRGERFFEEAQQ